MRKLLRLTLVQIALVVLPVVTVTAQQVEPLPKKDVSPDTISTMLQEQAKPLEQVIRNSADLEVDGLIVNETITKIGRDFYDLFYREWEEPVSAKNFTILIKEFPARGIGALVAISVNDETVLEFQLQPRYDIIEEVAKYAAAVMHEHLENNQLKKQLEAEGRREIERF